MEFSYRSILQVTVTALVLTYLGAVCWAMTSDKIAPKGKVAAEVAEHLR